MLSSLGRVLRQAVGLGEEEPECCTVCEDTCACCFAVNPAAALKNEGVVLEDPAL